jgi:hypothetical protein
MCGSPIVPIVIDDKLDSGIGDGFGGFVLACPLTMNNLPFFMLYTYFKNKELNYNNCIKS